ncbi:predicted protein [Sclerotinia sclerotiorum 1980 UF-70]|uniref:Uncharacterized protein n=1 Tax=Sclerotinia sclerotiorum (strain ATCC 18683 / 1980 / Ss-1) TaxID=665079 RepID=A7E878_SCLS1|nr:predicted protein [Sclerotinia sclerotiorum 1980 UF-70]EDN96580.1 predicted protein [Sclerotinia sclerotiorum 1980 UF-70]
MPTVALWWKFRDSGIWPQKIPFVLQSRKKSGADVGGGTTQNLLLDKTSWQAQPRIQHIPTLTIWRETPSDHNPFVAHLKTATFRSIHQDVSG